MPFDRRTLGVSPAALAATYSAQGALFLSPKDSTFGALGNGVTLTDAAITNGSAVMTSATAAFTSADVGKLVVVLPAPGSSQATFASSILSLNSATSVNLAATASYSGTNLEATYATDDTTALKAWLSSTSTATRFLPGGIYGFTDTLTPLFDKYAVLCSPGATLTAMAQFANPATWPGGARTVPTAVASSFTTLNKPLAGWTGGTIDCSILCDDGFAPKWVRTFPVEGLQVRNAKVRSFCFGDAQTSSSSYQVSVDGCLVWRDMGIVTVGGTALNSGGTPGSIGIYWDANCTDSTVSGKKTTVMGQQVGVEIHSGNISLVGTHAWCRQSIGVMDYGFDDYVGTNPHVNTYADTPARAGYRQRGSKGIYTNARAYNNSIYGTDNQAVGFIVDSPAANHAFVTPYIQGQDVTHRFAFDFAQLSGGVPVQLTLLPPTIIVGLITAFTAGVRWDTVTPRRVDPETTNFTLFSSDAGSIIEQTNAGATTITLPSTAGFPIGSECDLVQMGAGKVSVASDGTSTITSPGGLLGTRVQYSRVTIRRRTLTAWQLTGDVG